MRLRHATVELRLRTTFRIAHGASDTRNNVLVRLDEGWGEAAPVAYHHEDAGRVASFLDQNRSTIEGLDDPSAIVWLMDRLPGSNAGRAAVDMALHDLLGKRLHAPVRSLLGLAGLPHAQTSFTLPIAEPEQLRALAQAAAGYPFLKVKLGGPDDLAALRIIRAEAPQAQLRVDANGGWTVEMARRLLPELADLGVGVVEQPLPKGELAGLRELRGLAAVQIFADESVRGAADIPPLAGLVDGVNIKLQKAGGIAGARTAIATARAHGMAVMLGCMIETSLGVSAALALAGLADLLDLDGPLLIANDLFTGLEISGATLRATAGPGLGVVPLAPIAGLADEGRGPPV